MEMIHYYVFQIAAVLNKNDVHIIKDSNGNPLALDGTTIQTVLKAVFGIAGGIALIMVVLGGLKYINSLGNAQNVAKAKDTILYAIIGLVVCILGYSIVGFVLGKVG